MRLLLLVKSLHAQCTCLLRQGERGEREEGEGGDGKRERDGGREMKRERWRETNNYVYILHIF